jgi:molecular chaperone GrpE (heat shock protein)
MEQVNYRVGKYKVLPESIRQMWWKAKQEMDNFYQEASRMYSVPVSLTEKEIHTVLRDNPEILENFFRKCKTKKILRQTTDLCLEGLSGIYDKEEKSLQAREIEELFGGGDPKDPSYTNAFAKRKANTAKRRRILEGISRSWSRFKEV